MSQNCFSDNLLQWYAHNARSLPWRYPPCADSSDYIHNPYAVWLSEIMLQQTVVKAVIPYYQNFIKRYPTVHDLASADLESILQNWAGLGYYSRARNLHACAQSVVQHYNGIFPDNYAELRALPGIGDYTASAIMAIAFNKKANVIDGNVKRIIARYCAITTPLPDALSKISQEAEALLPDNNFRDYAQSLMDLGATICRPTQPDCLLCPVRSGCQAARQGKAQNYPVRKPRPVKPIRHAFAVIIYNDTSDEVCLYQRPPSGLLGGMWSFPGSEWQENSIFPTTDNFCQSWSIDCDNLQDCGVIEHIFTHFRLKLRVYYAHKTSSEPLREGKWIMRKDVTNLGLATVMKKIWQQGRGKILATT